MRHNTPSPTLERPHAAEPLSERDAEGNTRRVTCPGCARVVSLRGFGARTLREGRIQMIWAVNAHGAGARCSVRGVLIDPQTRTISATGVRARS